MKSRSHRPLMPTAPVDYWEDGSWTVDCPCGINFDDGEEMVDCDECGVWVHTRCSGFVKGEASFTCEKCKVKWPRCSSTADLQKGTNNSNGNSILAASDNEETEVAQLLVELPTKANTLPPLIHQRPAFRLWTQIPMEEKVHVNGVPGGDPSFFHGISSVISSSLWNCTGYVPKKFNFKYKDFPSLDSEESENPANTGANLLFSLSKEAVPYGAAEILAHMPSIRSSERREKKECNDGGKNPVKKHKNKLRAFPVSSSKTEEEVSIMDNRNSGKKKSMLCGYPKTSVNCKKRGMITTSTDCNMDHNEAAPCVKSDFQTIASDNKEEDISSQPLVTCNGTNVTDNILGQTTTALSSVALINDLSPEIHVKFGMLYDHNMENKNSPRTCDVPTADVANQVSLDGTKEEDIDVNVVYKQLNKGKDSSKILTGCSSKFEKDKLNHINGGVIIHELNMDSLPSNPDSISVFSRGPIEGANEEDLVSVDIQVAENLDTRGTSISFQKIDLKNSCILETQRKFDQSCENLNIFEPVNDFGSVIEKARDDLKKPEQMHHDYNLSQETKHYRHNEAKEQKIENELPSETTDMLEDLPERHLKASIKSPDSAEGEHRMITSVGKESSKLPISGSYRSTQPSTTFVKTGTKRLKLEDGFVCKDDGENVVMGDDTLCGEKMSRQTAKNHPRSLGCSGDKILQKKIFRAYSSKNSSDSKPTLLCPPSKKSSMANTPSSSPSDKLPCSSKNQGASSQPKFRTSGSLQRSERTNSKERTNISGSHTPGKITSHSIVTSPLSSSAKVSETLSDEELAKRLHQELNSSPRVSRLPRGFPAKSVQSASSVGSSMLSKRSSSSGGKYQVFVSRKKNKEETHRPVGGKDRTDMPSVLGKQHDSVISDGSEKDAHIRLSDSVPSAEINAELAATSGLF